MGGASKAGGRVGWLDAATSPAGCRFVAVECSLHRLQELPNSAIVCNISCVAPGRLSPGMIFTAGLGLLG
jgi:hypothetical protein